MKTLKPVKSTLILVMLMIANVMSAQSGEQKPTSNPYFGYQKTTNGLYYKFYTQAKGVSPQISELVDVFISCMVNDTTVIIPESENTIQLLESQFPGDLNECIAMMHVGDSASFIVNIDSIFIKTFAQPTLPEEFKSTDVMRIEIRLLDCYPESEYSLRYAAKMKKILDERIAQMKTDYPDETDNAARQLMEYFSSNGIKAEPTASGLYYVRVKEGNGVKPEIGQMVKAHYTGKLLDGTVFDSSIERNEPIVFVLGVGQVIPGWDEGIMMMSKGEKGVLYVPYYLAYGEREISDLIRPFSNLIFEVELIDFE